MPFTYSTMTKRFLFGLCVYPLVFLASKATSIITATGLQYTITQPGAGNVASTNQYIVFHFAGKMPDGTVFFDSRSNGEPSTYQLGAHSSHPKGLTDALALLPAGSKATLILPPELAYADKGMPLWKIEPNATLTYDVEVLGIKSKMLMDLLWDSYSSGGIAAAKAKFEELKSANFPDVVHWSGQLNYLGYGFLYQMNRFNDAIEIFQLNCELYPKNARIRDSLAEGYFVAGDRARAQTELDAVLAMDATVKSSESMLKQIKESPCSPTDLQRLQQLIRRAGAFGSPPFDKMPPNYAYLQERLDAILGQPQVAITDKTKLVESFLLLAQRSKASELVSLYAHYAANEDEAIRAAVQVAKDAPEKARLAREAAQKAKQEVQGKTVDIRFTALDGSEVDTTKLRGKVVLVDFWATWCGPCVEEIPNVVAAYEKYHDKGFEVVGITRDKDNKPTTEILDFTKKHHMLWPQCFDIKRGNQAFAKQFGIEAIPAMFLLDQNGMIVSTNARGPKLEEEVRRLLKLPPLESTRSN